MSEFDLHAVAERYHRALDAKPSKGPWTEEGIAAITDSVADVPYLMAEIERLGDRVDRLRLSDTYEPEGVEIVMAKLRYLRKRSQPPVVLGYALAEGSEHFVFITSGSRMVSRDEADRLSVLTIYARARVVVVCEVPHAE